MKITVEDFNKIEMRAGTVVHVEINKTAYKVDIDFGNEIGIKSTSAQITDLYNEENLVGKQVICCVNLPAIHIGSVKSEVRILGTNSTQGCVLLQPSQKVENGDIVF